MIFAYMTNAAQTYWTNSCLPSMQWLVATHDHVEQLVFYTWEVEVDMQLGNP